MIVIEPLLLCHPDLEFGCATEAGLGVAGFAQMASLPSCDQLRDQAMKTGQPICLVLLC
jgi:hypothetical protein